MLEFDFLATLCTIVKTILQSYDNLPCLEQVGLG
jgi:hypothetical protein